MSGFAYMVLSEVATTKKHSLHDLYVRDNIE